MMQDTIVEDKVIISKFWPMFSDTRENLIQHAQGPLVKVGQNFVYDTLFIVTVC